MIFASILRMRHPFKNSVIFLFGPLFLSALLIVRQGAHSFLSNTKKKGNTENIVKRPNKNHGQKSAVSNSAMALKPYIKYTMCQCDALLNYLYKLLLRCFIPFRLVGCCFSFCVRYQRILSMCRFRILSLSARYYSTVFASVSLSRFLVLLSISFGIARDSIDFYSNLSPNFVCSTLRHLFVERRLFIVYQNGLWSNTRVTLSVRCLTI